MEPTAIIGELTEAVREAAASAHNETELRIAFEPQLKQAIEASDWAVNWSARQEKTVAGGRADTVFGQAIIEYKSPTRSLRTANTPTAREALDELKRYMTGEEPDAAARVRTVGIATNGQHILFLRWHDRPEDPWEIEGPVEVSEESVAHMLHYLRAVARKRLSPEALADDFGPHSVAARAMVNALLPAFVEADDPKVATMFDEWDRIFGIVYGQDLRKALKDAEQLAEAYEVEGEADLKPLLFCVHTYFALFIKLLTAELMSQRHPMMPSFIGGLAAGSAEALRQKLADLEEGGIFAQLGITNFLEGDFFGWFLSVYDERLDRALRTMLRAMQSYEPATPTFLPDETRDLLKRLYQYLVPKKLRHDLGEYYTPDWLAELVLNEVGYEGDPNERVLDPACGSGTFLVLTIRRIRERMRAALLEPRETLYNILDNVVGFDLNPLAVIAARANYLLALGDLINYRDRPIRLPVYLCDSILTPSREQEQGRLIEAGMRLRTVVGNFDIPEAVVQEGRLEQLTGCLERCVRDGYAADEFLASAERDVGLSEQGFRDSRAMLDGLYRKLADLQAEGRNRIWARLIKNAFAPLFQPKFDYVVGNPPWVNWESLSDEYQEATRRLWVDYGLFSLSGHAARLGGGKKDLSMLFAYAGADSYLREGGRLGFVITQTLFKSKGAGDGFRRFQLGSGPFLRVESVHDLVDVKPFPGVGNRTAIFTCARSADEPTQYPVSYVLWTKSCAGAVDEEATLEEVEQQTQRHEMAASPIDQQQITSPWLSAEPRAIPALRKVIGASPYTAHEGFNSGGLNGVYWLSIRERLPDGSILINNLHDTGRKHVEAVTTAIEPDLVFPLVRGRDIGRWRAASSCYALIPQDPNRRVGWPLSVMQSQWPKTYGYLRRFEDELVQRSSSSVPKDPFYSVYAVSDYTFAPYKVVWRDMGEGMATAVMHSLDDRCLGPRVLVPEHHVMLVSFEEPQEPYYLCAALNSAPADLVVRGYTVSTQISAHVLEHVAVPQFNTSNEVHRRLADLSLRAHELVAQGEDGAEELAEVEEEVDRTAAELWGITDAELAAIKETLEELT